MCTIIVVIMTTAIIIKGLTGVIVSEDIGAETLSRLRCTARYAVSTFNNVSTVFANCNALYL